MKPYIEMNESELANTLEVEIKRYEKYVSSGLNLDMSRGKPSQAQLDLSSSLLTSVSHTSDCFSEDGTDCRNYGVLDGIAEAKEFMADLLDDNPETTIVLGNSSLNTMYDTIARCFNFGCLGSIPWGQLDRVAFICPTPGYDRHFAILEQFGIEMIPVEMTQSGPDMDKVEEIAANDVCVKGIWCVPKYSNPTGITYSDETVVRLASMKCAADDFRIFWDNAYCIHHLYNDANHQDKLYDIKKACIEQGHENRYIKFASTSKITFPGAGICAMAASLENVEEAKRLLSKQMIGADKLNQLRHVKFFPNRDSLTKHMEAQADIIRPKFELVENKLNEELSALKIAKWTKPNGGYFISFDGLKNTARETIRLASKAGVKLTNAGATYPYGNDPEDKNIRIAPTMPSLEELKGAIDVFCCCVKLAAISKGLGR